MTFLALFPAFREPAEAFRDAFLAGLAVDLAALRVVLTAFLALFAPVPARLAAGLEARPALRLAVFLPHLG